MTDEPQSHADLEVETSVTASPANGRSVERFGIVHVLVWTALTAVLLAVDREISVPSAGQTYVAIHLAFRTFYAILGGAAVTGLWITVSKRSQLRTAALEPGQWLLVLIGITVLSHVVVQLGLVFLDAMTMHRYRFLLGWTWVARYVLITLLFVVVALRFIASRQWRIALLVMAAVELIRAKTIVLLVTHQIWARVGLFVPWDLAAAAAVLFAVWKDRRLGVSRSWLHKLGAGIAVVDAVTTSAFYLLLNLVIR